MASPTRQTSSYSVFRASRKGGKRMWISCFNSTRHAGHVPHPGWGTLSILFSQDRWKINDVSRAEWPKELTSSHLGLFRTPRLPSLSLSILCARGKYKTNRISRFSMQKHANKKIIKTSRSSHSEALFVSSKVSWRDFVKANRKFSRQSRQSRLAFACPIIS